MIVEQLAREAGGAEQLELPLGVPHAGEGFDQGADAGAVDHGHFGQVDEEELALGREQLPDRLAKALFAPADG